MTSKSEVNWNVDEKRLARRSPPHSALIQPVEFILVNFVFFPLGQMGTQLMRISNNGNENFTLPLIQ